MNKLERKETYQINIIFDLLKPYLNPDIPDSLKRKSGKIVLDKDEIYANSQRYQTFFYKGCTCYKCGLKASFFAKEKMHNAGKYHLNLYGINKKGKEVLFTKDHIIPVSKGGKNHLSNYRTMCERCNTKRGNDTTLKDYAQYAYQRIEYKITNK